MLKEIIVASCRLVVLRDGVSNCPSTDLLCYHGKFLKIQLQCTCNKTFLNTASLTSPMTVLRRQLGFTHAITDMSFVVSQQEASRPLSLV